MANTDDENTPTRRTPMHHAPPAGGYHRRPIAAEDWPAGAGGAFTFPAGTRDVAAWHGLDLDELALELDVADSTRRSLRRRRAAELERRARRRARALAALELLALVALAAFVVYLGAGGDAWPR